MMHIFLVKLVNKGLLGILRESEHASFAEADYLGALNRGTKIGLMLTENLLGGKLVRRKSETFFGISPVFVLNTIVCSCGRIY